MDEVRVLLVEDEAGDARLVAEALQARGGAHHRVECVATLEAAEASLGRTPLPDVVLLDLTLPDSAGLPALDRLLVVGRVPIVVLTGLDDDELARAAVERGAQDYLVKGTVTGDGVARAIRNAVERHRLQAALRERAKELAGLFAISQVVQQDLDAATVCQEVAGHLATAMQWPQLCRAEVEVAGATGAAGPPAAADADVLAAEVVVQGVVRGRLQVGYAEPGRGFLLPDEQRLLDVAGGALAGWVRRHDVVQQLVAEQERLRALVSQLPGMLWTTDRDLRATSYGGASLVEIGIVDDRYVGVPITDLMSSPDDPELVAVFERALAGESIVFERQWRGRWWRNHLSPRWDGAGSVIGTVCLTLDVTVEHQQAAELDATRERFEGLFAGASDAMILADDDGRHLDANPAAAELTGHTREQLLALHAWDLVADAPDVATARSMWREFVVEGEMAGHVPMRRRDGGIVVTDFRAVANIVPGVHLWTLRDVTDHVRAEEALAASEQLFRTMADSAQDAIYRLRIVPDVALEYLNPAVEAMSGFPLDAVRRNPRLYLERMHPADHPEVELALMQPGTTMVLTMRFQHADGHWIWLEDNRAPIIEDGRAVGVQGVIRDITHQERTKHAMQVALESERRAAERLRAADELKNAFLTAVSHELRTPLTSVMGYAETLATRGDQLAPEQVQDLHRRLVSNASRLDELLGDLLDVGRLSRGAVQLDRVATDLTELVHVVARELEIGDHQLVVEPTLAVAEVDPRKVARILHNLLANAVRHAGPGSTIWVTCRAGPVEATIEVADDGPGIAPEVRPHVFEPFWQGATTRGAPSPGTGIGLALVRQFAVLHGGHVRVDDRPGGGVAFVVTLPVSSEVTVDQPE